MNNYLIEHKILTLAENAVMKDNKKPATFIQDDIEFSHWDFSYHDGWLKDQWISTMNIKATNYKEAISLFRLKLQKIIPRISLIGQSYIDFISEPFLILNDSYDIALIRYVKDRNPVGLMFTEEQQDALTQLLENKEIPEEFYYYWNDAVNTIGYPSKLLLMFSAIEALTKGKNKKETYIKIEAILGKEIKEDLFGTKGNSKNGLRHRLVHGEYFNPGDSKKDYLEIIHKKIITYFNDSIFNKKLIDENVTNPQRNFFENKDEAWFFIKSINGNIENLNLKEVLSDFDENEINKLKKYEIIYNRKNLGNY